MANLRYPATLKVSAGELRKKHALQNIQILKYPSKIFQVCSVVLDDSQTFTQTRTSTGMYSIHVA